MSTARAGLLPLLLGAESQVRARAIVAESRRVLMGRIGRRFFSDESDHSPAYRPMRTRGIGADAMAHISRSSGCTAGGSKLQAIRLSVAPERRMWLKQAAAGEGREADPRPPCHFWRHSEPLRHLTRERRRQRASGHPASGQEGVSSPEAASKTSERPRRRNVAGYSVKSANGIRLEDAPSWPALRRRRGSPRAETRRVTTNPERLAALGPIAAMFQTTITPSARM